ncbi:MAG: hypothetical protein P4L53_26815 [Candidatus Obscuribacterales bacterium]|nr:hypothetical protein [Candidatus Obscuribacterales bacterium]
MTPQPALNVNHAVNNQASEKFMQPFKEKSNLQKLFEEDIELERVC